MKILILAIVALAAIVGSAFFLGAQSPASPEAASTNVISPSADMPWIEESKKEEVMRESKTLEPQKSSVIPFELKIINQTPLEKIFEGESVKFEAVLVLSNGSKKVVTSEAIWQVLGGIGTIEKDGTFLPKLDDTVAEFGSAFGNVVAIWKDKTTLKEFLGKTQIFKVKARLIEEEIQNTLKPRG